MHRFASLGEERLYTLQKNTLNTRNRRNQDGKKFHLESGYVVVSERLRRSESLFFSNGSSRKSFTSLDTYFVLLEQIAYSPTNRARKKNHLVFCLLNHPRFTYRSYTTVYCWLYQCCHSCLQYLSSFRGLAKNL